jgi:peptidoglycan/LPS O-acetylase OafA/YrhL
MRRLHLAVGIFSVAAFLITGQFMRHHTPPMTALSDSSRLMFRSRHIYILGAGLVNLALGLYLQRHSAGWRRVIQAAGSTLVIAVDSGIHGRTQSRPPRRNAVEP